MGVRIIRGFFTFFAFFVLVKGLVRSNRVNVCKGLDTETNLPSLQLLSSLRLLPLTRR
jgi:hypothetical protein